MWKSQERIKPEHTAPAAECTPVSAPAPNVPLHAGLADGGHADAGRADAGHADSGLVDAGVLVIDIQAELAYWEQAYRLSSFHRRDFGFTDYRPSLKFAYDAYLWHYRQPLETLLPALHHKYRQVVPAGERLDWERMCRLVRAVWQRLLRNGPANTAPGLSRAAPAKKLQPAPRLRATVARPPPLPVHAPSRREDRTRFPPV